MLSPVDFIFNNDPEDSRMYFQSSFDYNSDVYGFLNDGEKPKSYSEWKFYENSISGDLSVEDTYEFLSKLIFPHESLSGYKFLKNDLLLPGVRYISPGIVVFERPPMHQVVSYTPEYRDNITNNNSAFDTYLPIPWQVYVASYNPKDMRLINVKMYFSSSSLYSETQPLYAPPLLNFYSNGELCRPFFPTTEDIEKYPQNITGIIASAYDWIWNSSFNLDITINISEYIYKSRYLQFEKYVKNTEAYDYFSWLQKHQLTNMLERPAIQYLISFFKCWESVPLEHISALEWSSFSLNQFFSQDYHNNLDSSDTAYLYDSDTAYLSDYLEIHDEIIVHEDEFEDSCHCEECCPPECWLVDDIFESYSFRVFVTEKKQSLLEQEQHQNTLADAVFLSSTHLASARVAQRLVSSNFFYSNFVECGSLLSSS